MERVSLGFFICLSKTGASTASVFPVAFGDEITTFEPLSISGIVNLWIFVSLPNLLKKGDQVYGRLFLICLSIRILLSILSIYVIFLL